MTETEFAQEHRIMIAIAEAGWRGSPCWHVLDWMCWKLRCKYPLVPKRDAVLNWEITS